MVLPLENLYIGLAKSIRTLHGTQSRVEQTASDASITCDKNQQRQDCDKAQRDRLTSEEREEMNARRREARRNKSIEERNARQRATRRNLTPEEKQEMNSRRWEASKNKPAVKKQEMNTRRRASRQSIPPEEHIFIFYYVLLSRAYYLCSKKEIDRTEATDIYFIMLICAAIKNKP
jgi:phage-related minor tail protein